MSDFPVLKNSLQRKFNIPGDTFQNKYKLLGIFIAN